MNGFLFFILFFDGRIKNTTIILTAIRWMSLYDSMKSLLKSRNSIETFYILEEHSNHDIRFKLMQRHWNFIERIIPVLNVYKKAIKILESDDFGTISFVLSSLYKIKTTIETLPKKFFHENILKFKSVYSEKMKEFKDSPIV